MDNGTVVDEIKDYLDSSSGADHIMLIEKLEKIGAIFQLLFGTIIIVIYIVVPIVVALEVSYIAFPPMRNVTTRLSTLMQAHSLSRLNTVLGFTFQDADRAIKIALAKGENSTNAEFLEYLKIKCKSLMVIMFFIALIIGGSDTIINFVGKLIHGIVF